MRAAVQQELEKPQRGISFLLFWSCFGVEALVFGLPLSCTALQPWLCPSHLVLSWSWPTLNLCGDFLASRWTCLITVDLLVCVRRRLLSQGCSALLDSPGCTDSIASACFAVNLSSQLCLPYRAFCHLLSLADSLLGRRRLTLISYLLNAWKSLLGFNCPHKMNDIKLASWRWLPTSQVTFI